MKSPRLPLVIRLWLLLVALSFAHTAWAEQGAVNCDFSEPRVVAPMTGILEGITATEPSNSRIKPTMTGIPYARHFAFGPYRKAAERSRAIGYRLIIRLDRYEWFARRWPYENWKSWEDYVRRQAEIWGRDVIYDIWNEPGLPEYWKGTRDQYFETYARAWRVLEKRLGPDAQATGPSTHAYSHAEITAFLDYCRVHEVRVPILNWHELTGTTAQGVRKNLRQTRRDFLENPKYAALGIQKILINETFPTEDAASVAAIFAALEAGGANGAVNSCFDGDCEKASLSGLLTADGTRAPRSSWHVYTAYAAGAKGRVKSLSSNPKIIGLGSGRVPGRPGVVQILIGYDATAKDSPTAQVRVNLHKLGMILGRADVEVATYRLANSQGNPSRGFAVENTERLSLRKEQLTFSRTLARQEVIVLELQTLRQ